MGRKNRLLRYFRPEPIQGKVFGVTAASGGLMARTMSESSMERDCGERRASPRRPLCFETKVQAEGESFAAKIVDASARGIYLESKTPVVCDTVVDVQFSVDDHEVFLSGRVVRADVIPVGKNAGFAVEFDLDATAILDRLRA